MKSASQKKTKKPSRLRTSGSEHVYNDFVYGSEEGIQSNNCYAYAIDHYTRTPGHKLQPGELAGDLTDMNIGSCTELRRRVKRDNPSIYPVKAEGSCRPGFFKVMAFLDKNDDYHWYKHHQDLLVKIKAGDTVKLIAKQFGVPCRNVIFPRQGVIALVKNARLWSHKRGLATGPLLEDACGRLITDPRRACRNYGEFDYKTMCGTFCTKNPMYNIPVRKRNRASPSRRNAVNTKGVNQAKRVTRKPRRNVKVLNVKK